MLAFPELLLFIVLVVTYLLDCNSTVGAGISSEDLKKKRVIEETIDYNMIGTCKLTDGQLGVCGSLQSCLEQGRKATNICEENWDVDTEMSFCNYIDTDETMAQGVCCRNSSESKIRCGTESHNSDDSDGVSQHTLIMWPVINTNCGKGPKTTYSFSEQTKIIGGLEAIPNSWPFMVSIRIGDYHHCGGSLLDSTHVLTAAHCVFGIPEKYKAYMAVVLGLHNADDITVDKMAVTRGIKTFDYHEKYNKLTYVNDIAVLTLDSPVEFNQYISPVCLPPLGSIDHYIGHEATVIGWGALENDGEYSKLLQQVTVRVNSNIRCQFMYFKNSSIKIDNGMLCASYPGRDSCQGDSGGPLLVQSRFGSRPWVQVGIVSFGIDCADIDYPGIYTRVTTFSRWIYERLRK